jgi:type I restriction enzyme M protein
MWEKIIFGIVLLHLIVGFGWAIYKMEFQKNKSDKNVLFINAEKEFGKSGSKNILREEDISKIINWMIIRDTDPFNTALVHNDAIKLNNYLLTVTSYVQSDDTREKVNIKSINETILRVVTQQNLLRKKVNEIVEEVDKELN